jgi:hypothetical protein
MRMVATLFRFAKINRTKFAPKSVSGYRGIGIVSHRTPAEMVHVVSLLAMRRRLGLTRIVPPDSDEDNVQCPLQVSFKQ